MDYRLGKDDCWQGRIGSVVMGCCLDTAELTDAGLEVRALSQVHGARIVNSAYADSALEADGLESDQSGVALVIRTADCVPVHMTDGVRIGIVHAGWRGTRAGIVRGLLSRFAPEEVSVVIGPCISGPRYEVDRDLYEDWLAVDPDLDGFLTPMASGSTKRAFDLGGFIQFDLERAGVAAQRVTRIPVCTYDSSLPSYRRTPGNPARIFNHIYRLEQS